MKENLIGALKNTDNTIKERVKEAIHYWDKPQCRGCVFCLYWRENIDQEWEYYTDGCQREKEGIQKLICQEGIKQKHEKPNKSLKNYAMSFIEQEKIRKSKLPMRNAENKSKPVNFEKQKEKAFA